MWFKKNNINNKYKMLPNFIGLISLILIFCLWLFLIKNISIFNFNIDKHDEINLVWENNDKININTNEEKLEPENKINILAVGRWWGDHDAPNLTDTIILASIDIDKKSINMLSIPRDLYVEYPNTEEKGKINWIYAKISHKTSNKKKWMIALEDKISEITGEKIDYFVNVDFNWFKTIIDTIWGVEINIPKNFIDEKYPDWNWWYRTLVFKKWTWLFDWENALKYARSRHSTSDFDRSLRQQQVIKAIKEKLTWSYFLTSPWKIKEIYEVFINHVYTDLSLWTIIKLAYNLNGTWEFKIISSNLNDSCFYWSDTCSKGWFLYTPNREYFWWMSVLLPHWTNKDTLSDYSYVKKFTNIIFNHSKIFEENYKINIFNSIKVNNLAWILSNNVVKYWFNIPSINSIWNTTQLYPKSIIYYNNIDENSETIKILKTFFKWDFIETKYPKYSKDNAEIEIIIWKDYILDENIFKF